MLPDGFEWRHDALWINGKKAAQLTDLPDGRCRVELQLGQRGHRHRFGPDRVTAVRYVEAWARKWETELRRAYTAADAAS